MEESIILQLYVEDGKSLRDIAKTFNTNHHKIKKILNEHNIELSKRKTRFFSEEHKRKIAESHIARTNYTKGYKQKKITVYRNMISKLRYEIDESWIFQFNDIDKLKYLNRSISKSRVSETFTTENYKNFIEKFYYDEKFNEYYAKWLETNDNWIKPSLDHVVPISKGGNSELSNFQYLTWFANHAKINMSHQEWNGIKSNINDYI